MSDRGPRRVPFPPEDQDTDENRPIGSWAEIGNDIPLLSDEMNPWLQNAPTLSSTSVEDLDYEATVYNYEVFPSPLPSLQKIPDRIPYSGNIVLHGFEKGESSGTKKLERIPDHDLSMQAKETIFYLQKDGAEEEPKESDKHNQLRRARKLYQREPGEAEEEFARIGTARLIKKVLTSRNPAPLRLPRAFGFGCSSQKPVTMPSWLSEDDVQYYASKYNEKGFTGGLNYYRAMDLNWELTAPWTDSQIKVPVKFIVGDLDLSYNIPGVKEYIHNGGFKKHVPFLQELVVMEGVAHFLNQEKPDEISEHIYDFIRRF